MKLYKPGVRVLITSWKTSTKLESICLYWLLKTCTFVHCKCSYIVFTSVDAPFSFHKTENGHSSFCFLEIQQCLIDSKYLLLNKSKKLL